MLIMIKKNDFIKLNFYKMTDCLLCYEKIIEPVFYLQNSLKQDINNPVLQNSLKQDINNPVLQNDYVLFDYCYNCLQLLLKTLWFHYIQQLKKTDCESSLKRLINQYPIYFTDSCINDHQPIVTFKYQNRIISGLLSTSLTLEETKKLDQELKQLNDVSLITALLQQFNL